MSRLFAPLTRHRRDKQAKQRSLDIDSKDPALITKSSSVSNGVKEKVAINANPPYYPAMINSRPATPPPVTENTNGPILHPLTPPQSPRAEPRPDTTPPGEGPEPAGDIAPIEGVPSAPNASHSPSPAPNPVLEASHQPLDAVKVAVAREQDLVDQDPSAELEQLSTEELRRQWEDQEIERFLRVFSRQVHEVRTPVDLLPAEGKARAGADIDLLAVVTENEYEGIDTTSATTTLNDEDGEEWRLDPDAATLSGSKNADSSLPPTSPNKMTGPLVVDVTKKVASGVVDAVHKSSGAFMTMMTEGQWPGQTPAEYIAMEWLIPYLPPAYRKTYHVSLGTMQATSSRLFLCTYPLYTPLMQRMWLLATWSKPRRSFVYCSLFWVFWWYNMLVPALLTRTLYEILRRRIFKYPAASELRSRLLAAERADAVADALTIQLDTHTGSSLGLRDVWRVWRVVVKGKRRRAKAMLQKGIDVSPVQSEPRYTEEIEDANFRRFALAAMEEIADFHERLVNVARWRRPEATRRYAVILFFSIILMIYTPAQILAKGIYAVLGIAFWLLPTVIQALPLEHLSRIPPPLGDVPTDADFAMGIIGQRSARGETVLPSSLCNKGRDRRGVTSSPTVNITSIGSATVGQIGGPYIDTGSGEIVNGTEDPSENGSENERKKKGGLRVKVSRGLIWVGECKNMMEGQNRAFYEHPEHLVKTYAAEYHASMGMLTTTPDMILFTSALSSNVKLKIPVQDIRSIRKTGRGMQIKYVIRADQKSNNIGGAMLGIPTGEIGLAEGTNATAPFTAGDNGEPMTKEERFRWIGGRDECFAQLVGLSPGRWIKM